MHKTHVKSFVFEILFIEDHSLTFYFSDDFDDKVWVYNLFSFCIRAFWKWDTFPMRHLVYDFTIWLLILPCFLAIWLADHRAG